MAHVLTSLGGGLRNHACNSRLELTKWIDYCSQWNGPFSECSTSRWGDQGSFESSRFYCHFGQEVHTRLLQAIQVLWAITGLGRCPESNRMRDREYEDYLLEWVNRNRVLTWWDHEEMNDPIWQFLFAVSIALKWPIDEDQLEYGAFPRVGGSLWPRMDGSLWPRMIYPKTLFSLMFSWLCLVWCFFQVW